MATKPVQDDPSVPDTEYSQYIAAELRNSKVHSSEYTSAHGILLARKLVLGLDEGRVGYGSIRSWTEKSRFKKDSLQVSKRLSGSWAEFPGIVPVLWMALGGNGKQTSAA